MNDKLNIYSFYSEPIKGCNSQIIQCDTLQELLYQLREAIEKNHKNIIIHTIQNGKQQ